MATTHFSWTTDYSKSPKAINRIKGAKRLSGGMWNNEAQSANYATKVS